MRQYAGNAVNLFVLVNEAKPQGIAEIAILTTSKAYQADTKKGACKTSIETEAYRLSFNPAQLIDFSKDLLKLAAILSEKEEHFEKLLNDVQ